MKGFWKRFLVRILLRTNYEGLKTEILDKLQRGEEEYKFQFAPKEVRADKDIVLAVIASPWYCRSSRQQNGGGNGNGSGGWMLRFASDELKTDKEVVLAACQRTGRALGYASNDLKDDKELVLIACRQDPWALEFASPKLKDDREIVLMACRQDGMSLQFVSDKLRANKEVVLVACRQYGGALQFASDDLKSDKEVVLDVCRYDGRAALEFANDDLKADKDVVLAACRQDGTALQFACAELRADKHVAATAAASHPDALKYAGGGLNQNKECLVAAKVWDDSSYYEQRKQQQQAKIHETGGGPPKIVLSTRFALQPNSYSQATTFAVFLKENKYIRQIRKALVYSPNAYAKDTCDPEWTRYDWPCRGTYETCKKKPDSLKMGEPQPESCWRYSFRYQLEKAKAIQGCMIQLVERCDENVHNNNNTYYINKKQSLGNGQRIETEMANAVGTKIFRVHAPGLNLRYDQEFTEPHIALVVSKLREWYEGGCTDMSECVIAFSDDDYNQSHTRLLTLAELRHQELI